MKELLIAQLDYIYFFYGLAFLISASIIFSLLKQEKSAIGLHLLGMFALLFGLVQWLNVVSILIYDGKALSIIRGAVTILSFLFLFEFGRGGLHLYKVRVPEKWIYFFPIAIILCGQFAGGIDGLLSASYYILGIPGALAAAAVFRFRYKEASRNKPYYLIFSVFFVLFGIVFSASVPKAAVFPCSIINEQSFLNYFHIPIQLLCGVLAFAFTVTFIFWVNELLEYGKKFKLSLQTATLYLPLTAVTVLVGCGWIVTNYISNSSEEIRRNWLVKLSAITASSIDHSQIESLSGTGADTEIASYKSLKTKLKSIRSKLNSDGYRTSCRFVYLLGLAGNKVFFFVDSEPEESEDMSPPGQIYNEASNDLLNCFKAGSPLVEGPSADQWGVWVSGLAPITNNQGEIVAVLGIDTNAEEWQKHYSLNRFFVITTIMMISVIVTAASIVVHMLMKETSKRLSTMEAREESENKYQLIFDNANDAILLMDENKVVDCNERSLEMFGCTREQIIGREPYLFSPSKQPDGIESSQKALEKIEATKEVKSQQFEFEHFKYDKTPFYAEVSLNVFMMKGKRLILSVVRDITERKRAEEKMKQLNKYLEEANGELKEFAYIASHDLREPLRKITSFGSILEKSLKDKINSDDSENLHFMIEGATRMRQMIDGLLSYSRVSSKVSDFENVDIGEIITDLEKFELSVLLEETQTKINIEQPLLGINADPIQMRQLIQNLIANGIKYRQKGGIPEITITSKPAADNMVRIEITDNGIGISPEYHSAIFTMFKRLHKRSEYEGTGIGLAVCKKIVQRHNGQIGVESQAGKGSTFWFTVGGAAKVVNLQTAV